MIDSRSINMSVTSGLRALRAVPRRRRAAFAAAAVLLAVGMVAAVRDGGSNLLLQRVIDGLSNGFVYSAMAVALVLIYKATTIVNFAQGEMAMFGVFICYAFWNSLGIPMAVAILLGMAVSAAAAACIERVLIRPFDPSNHLAITIVTLGLFLVLNAVAGVLWGFEPRAFPSPFPLANQRLSIFGASVEWTSLFTSVTILVAVSAIWLLLAKAKIGLAFRAVSTNVESSRLLGIHIGRTLQFGWALAAAMGTLAGALIAHTTYLDPNFMGRVLVFSFAAATLGGLDSVFGALLGGVVLGLLQTMAGGYLGFIGSELAPAVALLVIVAVLSFRPTGLFGSAKVERV